MGRGWRKAAEQSGEMWDLLDKDRRRRNWCQWQAEEILPSLYLRNVGSGMGASSLPWDKCQGSVVVPDKQ